MYWSHFRRPICLLPGLPISAGISPVNDSRNSTKSARSCPESLIALISLSRLRIGVAATGVKIDDVPGRFQTPIVHLCSFFDKFRSVGVLNALLSASTLVTL
jgi:hypothetical protein